MVWSARTELWPHVAIGNVSIMLSIIKAAMPCSLGGISYTIDTVRELRRLLGERPFAILLGSDAALKIRSWHEPEAVLDEARFVIFNRPETTMAPQTLHEIGFAPTRTQIVHLETPAIAAHQVRDRLARGLEIDDLVPAAVGDYIRAHHLYQ